MTQHPDTRETRNFARETKFLIDTSTARAVRDWARARLSPDLHGAGEFGDEYSTSTLYFDTGALDVFHRRGSFGRSKYRVRRYGVSDVVFFERKLRTSDRLVKRRTAAAIDELARLAADGEDAAWPINWFHQRLQVRELEPICRVSYQRTARMGMTAYGPMRLTLDDNLLAAATDDLAFGGQPGTPVIPGQAILELKYLADVPAAFKQLAGEFKLEPRALSKYRLAITALGLTAAATGAEQDAEPRRA